MMKLMTVLYICQISDNVFTDFLSHKTITTTCVKRLQTTNPQMSGFKCLLSLFHVFEHFSHPKGKAMFSSPVLLQVSVHLGVPRRRQLTVTRAAAISRHM